MRWTQARKTIGFTLVELLVVIGIIGVLIGLLVPMLGRARKTARQTATLSAMREMLYGYAAYHIEHKGTLMWGHPTGYINGHLLQVGLPTGQTIPPPGAGFWSVAILRYPARIAPYQQNSWNILYNHEDPSALPGVGDSDNVAAGKVYELSLYPTFGLNSVFMGGDKDFEGFTGIAPNFAPAFGKHAAFKATEIRRPTEQIVFVECQENTAAGKTEKGYFRAMPPVCRGRKWRAAPNGNAVELLENGQYGIPFGRWSPRAVTGFFDGHAVAMTIAELDDMRLWAKDAKSADFDYMP